MLHLCSIKELKFLFPKKTVHKQTVSSSRFGLLRAAGNGLTGHPAPLATPWILSELLPHSMSWMSCSPLSWQCSPTTRRLKHTGDGRLPTAVPSVSSHGPAALLPDTTRPGAGAMPVLTATESSAQLLPHPQPRSTCPATSPQQHSQEWPVLPAVALGQEGTELPSRLRPPGTWPARGCTDPGPQAPRRSGRWCEEYLQSGRGSGEHRVPPGFGQRAQAQPGSGGGRLVRRVRSPPGPRSRSRTSAGAGVLSPARGPGPLRGQRVHEGPDRGLPWALAGPAGPATAWAPPGPPQTLSQRSARPRRRPAPPPSVGKKPHQESIRGIFSRF